VRKRVVNTPQITTDGYSAYVDAVEEAFGADVHYATVTKEANFAKQIWQGQPDLDHTNTTFVERMNLTVRMQLRRHARRTNAHSKTMEGHKAAVALQISVYNWCRIHESIRVTPAMEVGLSKVVWPISELMGWASHFEEPLPDDPAPTRPRLRVVQGGKG